jgi:NADPH:quinone reductase-like Zn-dependent oxidoreductase
MRAVRFHRYGTAGELRVDTVPDPVPGPGEVVVRVRACAVNHWDVDMRNGTSRLPLELPHTPGIEVAGDVVALGERVEDVEPGERVMPIFQWHCGRCEWCAAGQHHHCSEVRMLGVTEPGGYADYVVVPAWTVRRLADSVPYEEAAALQGTYAPVWHALVNRIGVRPGMTVLVNAVGSGAGSAGLQVAVLMGARVIASAGSDDKLRRALAEGADGVVNYRAQDLTAQVRELTGGRGVDVVLECVGGELFGPSLRALARDGRLVTIGAHAGEEVPLDIVPLFRNQWSIIGSVRCTVPDIEQVLQLLTEGRLRPIVHRTYALEEAARAHDDLEARRHYGKLILVTEEADRASPEFTD